MPEDGSVPDRESQRGPIPDVSALRPERTIHFVLRLGVWLSASLIVAGLLAVTHPLGRASVQSTASTVISGGRELEAIRSPQDVMARLGQGDASAVVTLGLVVLMLTPLAAVFLSLVSFWQERDRPFIAIAFCALAFLVLGFLWAR